MQKLSKKQLTKLGVLFLAATLAFFGRAFPMDRTPRVRTDPKASEEPPGPGSVRHQVLFIGRVGGVAVGSPAAHGHRQTAPGRRRRCGAAARPQSRE